jgi:hypothetical protein
MKGFFEAGRSARSLFYVALAIATLGLPARGLSAVTCNVLKHNPPTEADKAMLAGDYARAEGLYQAALQKQAGDVDSTVDLVHALLREQKVSEAADAVKDALEATPKSAALITLRGEVEFRQGELWLVEPTVVESYKIDPCNPRTRLLFARVAEASSRYATARQQILLAHQFDPEDPEIRLMWIETLPLQQRVAELDAYLSAPSGDDVPELAQLRADLDRWKKESSEPVRACRLVSPASTAEIPFIRLAGYAGHARAYGLEVGLNGAPTRLQIDTRGAGITVYRSAADHAGLKRVGGEKESAAAGPKANYAAVADSVKVGGLEFKDCVVNVIDSSTPFDDGAGSIGFDVFSDFLVTVDFPMRKLGLGPLPARPGGAASVPGLKTSAADFDPLEALVEAAKPAGTGTEAAAAAPKTVGPFDRFIAPEMKDYSQIYRAGHDLILPTALGGEKIKLFVPDATATETSISAMTALDLPKVHEDKTKEQPGPGGRTQKVFFVDEISFNFAHVAQKLNGVYSTDTSWASKSDGTEVAGILGMNTTLILLTLHIDYRDGLLKAEYVPGRGSDKME